MPTLQEAINELETAQSALATSDADKATAQSKFNAAQSALAAVATSNDIAVATFNTAVDSLIVVLQTSKRSAPVTIGGTR